MTRLDYSAISHERLAYCPLLHRHSLGEEIGKHSHLTDHTHPQQNTRSLCADVNCVECPLFIQWATLWRVEGGRWLCPNCLYDTDPESTHRLKFVKTKHPQDCPTGYTALFYTEGECERCGAGSIVLGYGIPKP